MARVRNENGVNEKLEIYNRNQYYRIARPGWFFWHWARAGESVFQTESLNEAYNALHRLQAEPIETFRNSRWRKIELLK